MTKLAPWEKIDWEKINFKLFFLCGLCAFAVVFLAFRPAAMAQEEASKDPGVDFRWAFASKSPKGEISAVMRDMSLKTGDRLKMMIELRRKCFVYVFHYNPQDGLKLLFPYALALFDSDYRTNYRYLVPRGENWFQLDNNPGQESFYLIASANRLTELEKDYQRCETAPAGGRAEAEKAVLERIRALRREHREITTPAERPIPIGGAVREIKPVDEPHGADIASFADEVASTGFVARTYTIEHK